MGNRDEELTAIKVYNTCEISRCECWKHNVANQFPIKSIGNSNGELVVEVGAPHEGYTIQTTLVNYKLDGQSCIISDEKVIVADINFENGAASGPCSLYDESGVLFFRGNLVNGYRQGKGTEYDINGKKIFQGFFDKGKKRPILKNRERRNYWEEYDENGNLINISQRDDDGNMMGICYLYSSEGTISRISEWKEGREICLIKQFSGKYMTEYKRGVIRYIGEYKNTFKSDYAYEGEGKLYENDGKSMIYKGSFCNGKRHGMGISYRKGKLCHNGRWIINIPACLFFIYYTLIVLIFVLAFLLNWFIAIILLGVFIFFIILKRIYARQMGDWLNLIDYACLGEILYSTQKKKYDTEKKEGVCLRLNHHLFSIVLLFLIILFCIAIIYYLNCRPCNGFLLQWSFTIGSNKCNNINVFQPVGKLTLNSITVKDESFKSVYLFKLENMNQLKSVTIGSSSFCISNYGINMDESKSFHILNCESLESIEIGKYSFNDFGGQFELKNLPSLQSIQIGTIGSESRNFYWSSFVIRGILNDIEYVMIRSS